MKNSFVLGIMPGVLGVMPAEKVMKKQAARLKQTGGKQYLFN